MNLQNQNLKNKKNSINLKVLRNEKGFFALGLVFIIFLSFIPVANFVNNSMESAGAKGLDYRSKTQQSQVAQDIKLYLYNEENCKKAFSGLVEGLTALSFSSMPQASINEFNKDVIYNNKGVISFSLKRAALCIDKSSTRPECDQLETQSFEKDGKDLNPNALLFLEIYSEWEDKTFKEKKIPIFVEIDKNTKKVTRCSTSPPIRNSLNCPAVIVSRACCRYLYTHTLEEHPINAKSPNSPLIDIPKNINSATQISSNSGASAKEECEGSLNNFRVKAVCHSSHWNYTTSCEK